MAASRPPHGAGRRRARPAHRRARRGRGARGESGARSGTGSCGRGTRSPPSARPCSGPPDTAACGCPRRRTRSSRPAAARGGRSTSPPARRSPAAWATGPRPGTVSYGGAAFTKYNHFGIRSPADVHRHPSAAATPTTSSTTAATPAAPGTCRAAGRWPRRPRHRGTHVRDRLAAHPNDLIGPVWTAPASTRPSTSPRRRPPRDHARVRRGCPSGCPRGPDRRATEISQRRRGAFSPRIPFRFRAAVSVPCTLRAEPP